MDKWCQRLVSREERRISIIPFSTEMIAIRINNRYNVK